MGIVVNIPTEGGIIEARIGSPDGNLVGTLNATAASGRPVGGVYGAGSLMKIKVNKLGVTEPQTLYLCYKAPDDAPIAEETIELAKIQMWPSFLLGRMKKLLRKRLTG
jgi:beta-glucosidase